VPQATFAHESWQIVSEALHVLKTFEVTMGNQVVRVG
jgi:hypothetical protein